MRRTEPKSEAVDLEVLTEKVWSLPFLDRVSILTLTIIDHEREALAEVNGLIALVGRMSGSYGTRNRIMIAERLRSAADLLDHELQDAAVLRD